MFDPSSIATGVTTSIASQKVMEELDNHHTHTVESLLRELIETIHEARNFFALHTPPVEEHDLFKIVTLYKGGPAYIPTQIRNYVRVLAAVDTPVAIISNIGNFVYTIKAGTWTDFNFPDNTQCILDISATNTQQNIYVRYTNQEP